MDSRSGDFLIPIFMKRLYEGDGEMRIEKAIQFIRTNSPKGMLCTAEDIKHWFRLHSNYFKLDGVVVLGITNVRLCAKHCVEPGLCREECDRLHICKFFILTNGLKCRRDCRFGHNLDIPHNHSVLMKYQLQFLKEEELRRLFRRTENRNRQTLPAICRNFNMGKCEKMNCRYLHICQQFIFNNYCQFGMKCKVSHLIDSKIIAILNDYAIYLPQNISVGIHELKKMFNSAYYEPPVAIDRGLFKAESSNDLFTGNSPLNNPLMNDDTRRLCSSMMNLSIIPKGQQQRRRRGRNVIQNKAMDTKKIKGICMKSLSGNPCSAEECLFHHKTCPYQWQYNLPPGDDWKDFDASMNEDIEEGYCLLNSEFHAAGKSGFIRYDFETMKFTSLKTTGNLRRLSTPSSVSSLKSNFKTVWIWYWKNDSEHWMEYNADNPESPPLSSPEIESKYLFNKEGQMNFIHEGKLCIIDFKKMVQEMIGKKIAVCRRPKFFRGTKRKEDANKFKPKPTRNKHQRDTRKRRTSDVEKKNDYKMMNDSESMTVTDFRIVKLHENDSEFQHISDKFNETMEARGAKIMCIESIQNGELLEEYERRKNKLSRKFGNLSSINEIELFHGTLSRNIPAISKQGFDVRLSGEQVGIRFGRGSYFTKKADYAHKYLDPEEGTCKMILAKVLAGLSCKGRISYVRPPLIDPENKEGDFYNSCVDNEENPNVFVIFANDQMYPAYIITYEMTLEV